ncbi:hypothetical protein [Arthrobacter sp. 162MFSha1.1]|uniref:hypothetical protein n=1 Tax=Arthrobacter sp. 162MFSha1.1 TaxID=1151119 RepID=UPI0003688A3D|nr:hypothetical protein [Arthrobacter sp. 162MFSha1.1]
MKHNESQHEQFLETYAAMSADQQAAHIKQHEGLVDEQVDMFEITNEIRGLDVRADSRWEHSIYYTTRYRWAKGGFAVDRRYAVEEQISRIELGLKEVMAEYARTEMEKGLRELFNQHGVTEDVEA